MIFGGLYISPQNAYNHLTARAFVVAYHPLRGPCRFFFWTLTIEYSEEIHRWLVHPCPKTIRSSKTNTKRILLPLLAMLIMKKSLKRIGVPQENTSSPARGFVPLFFLARRAVQPPARHIDDMSRRCKAPKLIPVWDIVPVLFRDISPRPGRKRTPANHPRGGSGR